MLHTCMSIIIHVINNMKRRNKITYYHVLHIKFCVTDVHVNVRDVPHIQLRVCRCLPSLVLLGYSWHQSCLLCCLLFRNLLWVLVSTGKFGACLITRGLIYESYYSYLLWVTLNISSNFTWYKQVEIGSKCQYKTAFYSEFSL